MTILPMIPIIAALALGGGGQVAPKPAESARPAKPAPVVRVTGAATWYAYHRGQAAAGPALRAALGKRWRGKRVTVCNHMDTCVVVRLTDWCRCGHGRVIDLDPRDFAVLAPTSRGVIRITIRPRF